MVLDDLMEDAANSIAASSLYTGGGHYRRLSVTTTMQND